MSFDWVRRFGITPLVFCAALYSCSSQSTNTSGNSGGTSSGGASEGGTSSGGSSSGGLGGDAAPDVSTDAAECPPPPPDCLDSVAFSCPNSTSCYFMCFTRASNENATLACANWGGCLATVGNQPEWDCLTQQIKAQLDAGGGSAAWFDYKQLKGPDAGPKDGWAPACGTDTGYNPTWSPGYGTDGADMIENGESDCGVITINSALWDYSCAAKLSYFCEVRPVP